MGLAVAWAWWPRSYASGLAVREGEQVFGHYLKIGTDGRVTVALPQVETGQGAWTALAQALGDELGADWSKVAVEPAPLGPIGDNPLGQDLARGRVTAGATSIRAFAGPMREAGAIARVMLCAAAAKRWGVSADECDTVEGHVVHEGRRLEFGSLAEAAAGVAPPDEARLRETGSGGLAARSLARLDSPPKADGSLRFVADVRLSGMVYASARLGEVIQVRGGPEIHRGPGWVAAVGSTGWAARAAIAAAQPRFAAADKGDEAGFEAALDQAIAGLSEPPMRGRTVSAVYSQQPLLHLGLEPLGATARWSDGRLELWAATQAPDATRAEAAKAAGVGVGEVLLFAMPVGAPDGRALHADAVPVAAALAKKLGRPVSVTVDPAWSRRAARPLGPARARVRAQLNRDSRVALWSARIVGAQETEFPYALPEVSIEQPEVSIEQAASEQGLKPGYLRGGQWLFSTFVRESFVDELARRGGFEPLAYRMAMLGGNPRLARVLTAAAAIGGWDGGGAGSSMGLACLSAAGSHLAVLAIATIGPDQRIVVERLVAAIDCGRPINPGLIRQQVEGGLLAGLALATAGPVSWHGGMPVGGGSAALGLQGTPAITVEVVPSTSPPGGLSGLGTAALAPAVANAIAAGTGRRLRNLPFAPMSPQ